MKKRVKTGIAGLDDMLAGGLLDGSAVLVKGAPGTGKTTLGLQFLWHGATQEDEAGLLVTFEEFPQSLHRDARTLGWDLRRLEEGRKLKIVFTSPRVFLSSLEVPGSPLNRTIMEWDVRRVVLDSITHFTRLTTDPAELRSVYNKVVNGLKREGVTSILTSEGATVGLDAQEKGRLSFVVDAIILLRHVEIESAMQRALLVLKMRGSDHAKDIRRFEIDEGGVRITGRFEGREGLLTGSPHRVPSVR
jgi:circadian clock protein KaiC